MENTYTAYPEGFIKLAEELKMPTDDIEMKKIYLYMLVTTLALN